MRKTTLKEIRNAVRLGLAVDITSAAEVPTNYEKIAYSVGVYGLNGCLIQDRTTGEMYAVTARSTNLFILI